MEFRKAHRRARCIAEPDCWTGPNPARETEWRAPAGRLPIDVRAKLDALGAHRQARAKTLSESLLAGGADDRQNALFHDRKRGDRRPLSRSIWNRDKDPTRALWRHRASGALLGPAGVRFFWLFKMRQGISLVASGDRNLPRSRPRREFHHSSPAWRVGTGDGRDRARVATDPGRSPRGGHTEP